jgi:mannan endo-1,4-beta-mannosidase
MAQVSRRSVLKVAAVGAIAAGGAGGFLSRRVAAAAGPAPADKVTRSGTQLLLNGQPYRLVGLDMWPMAVASWCQPANYDGRNVSQISQVLADIRQTAPNVNAIKVWFYQQFALHNGSRDWSSFDAVLAAADTAGFKVIANLEDSWSYERTGSQMPEVSATWYDGGYQNSVLTDEVIPYRQWVQECATRYANDPRILMWELVAEPNGVTLGFIQDVSALVKGIDPYTPICCGEVGPLSSAIYALSTVDVASYHYYTAYGQTNWKAVQLAAAAAGKPWFMGEYGINSSTDHSTRASTLQADMTAVFQHANTAGFMYWQYAETGGDQFNCTKGDPLLPVLDQFVNPTAPPPPPPVLPAPGNPADADKEVVSWDAVSGADHYRVRLLQGGTVIRVRATAGTAWGWTPLTSGVTYQWQVAAVDASGNVGTYTALRQFTAGGGA